MIYLVKNSMNYIIGIFETTTLANEYLNSIGITTFEDFSYLMRINDMKYISRICFVNDTCIYNNKLFWTSTAQNVLVDYDAYTVKDCFGVTIYKDQFKKELDTNSMRINDIYTTADQVNYNMTIGNEFISLFREECVNGDLGPLNGLDIATKTANVIPLVMTGSFKEAAYVLANIPTDVFLTTELLAKYKNMLLSADAITYQR